ncbi:hypothetical protein [Streptomyces himalayensis]|uniref:Secreted protein n=2 Tax=Streptomyces himalayensis TaxID=2820085 RepID=A0A7W2HKK4_9ACTN|nr:hypothetical protein [Streptomyces himalayensis]MBA2947074.1 hypothetical protein [Streptomyces himalayensis subsp. himalayensis]MBA4867223.1 hypothetical protein [Streptomyces himalayensis subsp. aureolus]
MRKILATAATFGLASLGVIVPATSAQASVNCDYAWNNAALGYFYAYAAQGCTDYLGRSSGNDSDWGNSTGGFQGSDTNRAGSILHKGTSGMAVQVFNGTGTDWAGGHTCIKQSEYYMSILFPHSFTSGYQVSDAISSHRWVWASECDKFLDS